MEEYIIRAEQLNKVFPLKKGQTVEALKSLDLTVKQGGLTAIIGPDGAGKTTFMRLVAGLMRPTGGRLTVLGLDSVQGAGEIQTRISYMPQKFGLYEDLTVQENMDLYADLHGVPAQTRPARFDKLLTMMGLERFTGRLAGKLSGGMKQKLGLACTLVRSPELLLLDEPTVGVDPLSRRELWEILKEFVRDENLTVLVNTAYMNEAALCGQVYVLHKGALLAHGTPDDLRAIAAGRCYSCTPPPGEPTRILQAHLIDDTDHVVDAVPKGGDVHFILQEGVASAPYLDAHGIAARPVASDLEDGFMVLLHRAETEILPPVEEGDDVLDKGGRPTDKVSITVRDLVKKFGDFTAVAHTSFEVHEGEVFGLLGPNGAGKTTTFKMLCGLLPATSGFLSVAGVDLHVARTQARANVGYVAQKFSLYGNLTVRDNLEFFAGIYGLPPKRRRERIGQVVREFFLEDRPCRLQIRQRGRNLQSCLLESCLVPEEGTAGHCHRQTHQRSLRITAGCQIRVAVLGEIQRIGNGIQVQIQISQRLVILADPVKVGLLDVGHRTGLILQRLGGFPVAAAPLAGRVIDGDARIFCLECLDGRHRGRLTGLTAPPVKRQRALLIIGRRLIRMHHAGTSQKRSRHRRSHHHGISLFSHLSPPFL